MAVTVYVVDDAKCLHDLAAILEAETAPVNHASSTNEYGEGTFSNYGHVRKTAESAAQLPWDIASRYTGKVVSAEDGKDFYTRIKQNAAAIVAMQVPVHTVVLSTSVASASVMADEMGYGTWTLLLHDVITTEGGGSKDLFYWERTA